ncbi:MAG: hypothetical protein ACSHX8_02560 [Opitutaceae bacterium]
MKTRYAYLLLLLLTSIGFLSTPITSSAEEQKRSFWNRIFGNDDSTVKEDIQTDATARGRIGDSEKGHRHSDDEATTTDTRNTESDREAAQHERRREYQQREEAEKQAERERRKEEEAARKKREDEAANQAKREEALKRRHQSEENGQDDDDEKNANAHFSDEERKALESWQKGNTKSKKSKKSLPPGLQKKVARGGELPPGWKKKLEIGSVLDPELEKEAQPLPEEILKRLPKTPEGTEIIKIGDEVIRIFENSGEIIDILSGARERGKD